MTAVFVLDVPENRGVIEVAGQDPLLTVDEVGPYFRISATGESAGDSGDEPLGAGHSSTTGEIVIDRRATACRHAVWYSAIAGLQGARIVQHDKNALRVVPG
ncbi:hypothetical protein AB0C21_17870 [Spirillospora sp. NPDC049024]